MRTMILLGFSALSLLAQGSAVNQTSGPPPQNWVQLFWCGTSMTACAAANTQVSAICYAPAQVATTTYAIGSNPALTSIVVLTNVGTINFGATAQLWVGQRITVAGSTTSALNGTYRVNAVSGTTATITTSGVANGTYNNAAMTLSTSQPVLNATVWSIQLFPYTDASTNASYFANGGTIPTQGLACSTRTTY
jgi:hypothetical protein